MDPLAVLLLCPEFARILAVPLFAPRAKPDNGAPCPEPPPGTWYGLAAPVIFLGPRVAAAVAGSAVLIAVGAGLLIDLLGAHHPAVAPLPVAAPVPTCACGEPACGMSTGAGMPRLLDLSDPPGKLRGGALRA